jgi:hypothetical protein
VDGSQADEVMGDKSAIITLVSSEDKCFEIMHKAAVLSHPPDA